MDIICTIGPASWDPQVMKQMLLNGMTIPRLNGAFIDIPEMSRVQDLVNNLANEIDLKLGRDYKFLLDIKGVELRLNKFPEKFVLKQGDKFILGSNPSFKFYPITYPDLYRDIEIGAPILIDKGKIQMKVLNKDLEKGLIECLVIHGGELIGGKGMNVPGTFLNNNPITEIDLEQIAFALENNWDYLACSFIRSKSDIDYIKNAINDRFQINIDKTNLKIIAKIEDGFGLAKIDEILPSVYGIMIARGDLAAEIGYVQIPEVQNFLAEKAQEYGKYCIWATEAIESMVNSELPAKSDLTDIYVAINNKVSAIMMSEETTKGMYPAECVRVYSEMIDYYGNVAK